MANVLNRPLPQSLHTGDRAGTARAYALASRALRLAYPRLSNHVCENLSLSDAELWAPSLSSLLGNGLDLDRMSRVWDCWVFEGDAIMVAAAVAVYGGIESQLLAFAPGGADGTDGAGSAHAAALVGWGRKVPPRRVGSRAVSRNPSPAGSERVSVSASARSSGSVARSVGGNGSGAGHVNDVSSRPASPTLSAVTADNDSRRASATSTATTAMSTAASASAVSIGGPMSDGAARAAGCYWTLEEDIDVFMARVRRLVQAV